MRFDLTVIIPTYNEKENIEKMIVTVDTICREHTITEEILVVDDNSDDGTIQTVKDLQSRMTNLNLIIRTRNPGLSQSLYEGMLNAGSELIQCIDCDFSHPPEKIPQFYYFLKHEGFDMVIGSRYVAGGAVIHWPVLRRVLSYGAALLGRLLIPPVKDSGSGFFALNKKIIAGTKLTPRGFRMGFEILGKGKWLHVKEIPITFIDRERGSSKMRMSIITDYLKQWFHVLYFNLIKKESNNIFYAWKIFLTGKSDIYPKH
jgi:dolichol-phosphate mannosyltransferase